MAENPLAIRVNEETKELFNQLAEKGAFENKGEFLNRLLTLYQSEKMKDNISALKPAVEAVETLTDRLLEILNGTGAMILTKDEKHKEELEAQRLSFEETRALLQQRISVLEQGCAADEERIQAFISEKENADKKADELHGQIRQLESAIADKTALINEYKEKNDALNSIIVEYKDSVSENKKLNTDIDILRQENILLQGQINDLKTEQARQSESRERDQAHLRAGLTLEKETALLELKTQCQNRLEEQQAKHATAISGYEGKVRELLGLTESTASPSAKKGASASSRSRASANKKAGKTETSAGQTEDGG